MPLEQLQQKIKAQRTEYTQDVVADFIRVLTNVRLLQQHRSPKQFHLVKRMKRLIQKLWGNYPV